MPQPEVTPSPDRPRRTVGPRYAPPDLGRRGEERMRAKRLVATLLGVAATLLADQPGASAEDIQMKAAFTVVVCRATAPDVCEVREATADALLCLTANRNVAEEQVPEGYVLRSFRCVPQAWWLAPEHRPRGGSSGPLVGADGQGPG